MTLGLLLWFRFDINLQWLTVTSHLATAPHHPAFVFHLSEPFSSQFQQQTHSLSASVVTPEGTETTDKLSTLFSRPDNPSRPELSLLIRLVSLANTPLRPVDRFLLVFFVPPPLSAPGGEASRIQRAMASARSVVIGQGWLFESSSSPVASDGDGFGLRPGVSVVVAAGCGNSVTG